jgi:hypothetical protein
MSTFALDKNYNAFNFEEISIAELDVISGGSGSGTAQCALGTLGGAGLGALAGAAYGPWGAVAGAIAGGAAGAAASCFG